MRKIAMRIAGLLWVLLAALLLARLRRLGQRSGHAGDADRAATDGADGIVDDGGERAEAAARAARRSSRSMADDDSRRAQGSPPRAACQAQFAQAVATSPAPGRARRGKAAGETRRLRAAAAGRQLRGRRQGRASPAPMLIYTARLHLAVFEAKKAMDAAEKLARDSGGYLVRRNDRTITFRVPAGKFQGTLADVIKLGDVLHREVTARDVTEEFFDVQVRLQNLEAVRARFEELLKRANKVEEALAVERELERVAGQIEQLKGRLKLLKELVAFSTITVEFQPRATDQVESVVRLPFPWLQHLGLGELLRL